MNNTIDKGATMAVVGQLIHLHEDAIRHYQEGHDHVNYPRMKDLFLKLIRIHGQAKEQLQTSTTGLDSIPLRTMRSTFTVIHKEDEKYTKALQKNNQYQLYDLLYRTEMDILDQYKSALDNNATIGELQTTFTAIADKLLQVTQRLERVKTVPSIENVLVGL